MGIVMHAMRPMLWVRRRLRPEARARCAEVARWLQRYLDGEVDAVTLRLVRAHLEVCRRCGLDAETYRALKEALARRTEPSPEPVARLRAFADRLSADDGDVHEQP
jgi:anti-sigma factor RsiW